LVGVGVVYVKWLGFGCVHFCQYSFTTFEKRRERDDETKKEGC